MSAQTPVITYAIIGVCVALWVGDILTKGVITQYLGFTPIHGLYQPWRITSKSATCTPSRLKRITASTF